MNQRKSRYPLVDAVRGFSVLSMIVFHFFYDIFVVWGANPDWYYAPLIQFWQQSICWTFILVSGFVWQWGRRTNVRRGLLLNLWGAIISAVMLLVMPSEPVWFGVLTFLGCALLLMEVLERVVSRVPPLAGLAVSFFLFILLKEVQFGYLSLGPLWRWDLPEVLYRVKVLVFFGFQYPGFYSSDYFPIFPWMFLFLCGYYLFQLFQRAPRWQRLARKPVPLLTAMGQKSLAVYLIHQPVCYLVSMVFMGTL